MESEILTEMKDNRISRLIIPIATVFREYGILACMEFVYFSVRKVASIHLYSEMSHE